MLDLIPMHYHSLRLCLNALKFDYIEPTINRMLQLSSNGVVFLGLDPLIIVLIDIVLDLSSSNGESRSLI